MRNLPIACPKHGENMTYKETDWSGTWYCCLLCGWQVPAEGISQERIDDKDVVVTIEDKSGELVTIRRRKKGPRVLGKAI